MNRKEFLQSTGKLITGLCAAGWLFSGCNALYYATATEENGQLRIRKKEFLTIKNNHTSERKFILIHPHSHSAPIGILKRDEDQYIATLLECTHRGCELHPGGNIYTCPCHGSEFSMEGEVLQGPAEKDLKTFEISTDHENIYIHL